MTTSERDPRHDPMRKDETRSRNSVGYEIHRKVEKIRERGNRVDYSVNGVTGYTVELREWRSRNRGAEVVYAAD